MTLDQDQVELTQIEADTLEFRGAIVLRAGDRVRQDTCFVLGDVFDELSGDDRFMEPFEDVVDGATGAEAVLPAGLIYAAIRAAFNFAEDELVVLKDACLAAWDSLTEDREDVDGGPAPSQAD